MVNKNRQKVILTGRPIFQGEGVTAHLGHQAFCLPLHDVASHVKVKQFKVDRLQIIVVGKKYIYVSQLFISRMPKMRAIPQLVSAPLYPIPIITVTQLNIVPFWKSFVARKMSTILKSGLYSTFSLIHHYE